jgi:hypothetical protein
MLRKKKSPEEEARHQSVSQFNSAIIKLVNEMARYEPKNPDILYIQSSVSTIVRQDASLILSSIVQGKYFDEFLDKIKSKDESYFLAIDYSNKVNQIGKEVESAEANATARWTQFIEKLKINYRTIYNQDTKKMIWDNLQKMVTSYETFK